jgi:tRNA (cytidine/uridine-2'-O-)-methyltransferase
MESTGEKYDTRYFNIVLVEPEIPNNTGNIGRLCVGGKSHLHLIKPMGFEISDSRVKRAGLDYWPELELSQYENFDEWLSKVPNKERIFLFSSRASKSYHSVTLKKGDWLVFGKESVGLSPEVLNLFPDQQVCIPFPGKVRSFNISNAVAMVLGEGLRQVCSH